MPTPLKMAGLFAGIGGIELGFQRALGDGVETTLLCEWWEPAKTVLATHFPEVELHPDVRLLDSLPAGENFDDLARLLCDQAVLLEDGELAQAADFSQRLNRLLLRLAGATAAA